MPTQVGAWVSEMDDLGHLRAHSQSIHHLYSFPAARYTALAGTHVLTSSPAPRQASAPLGCTALSMMDMSRYSWRASLIPAGTNISG